MTSTRLRLAAATAATTLACAAQTAAAAPEIPFQATLLFKETVSFTFAEPCFAVGTLTGAGLARPGGPVVATSQDCINPLGAFDANAPALQFVSDPRVVFDFGKGHQLFATYSGTLTPRANAPHAVAGHFTVTGGTGRFRGATGGGTVSGFENIVTSPATGQVTFSGRLVPALPQD